MSDLPHLSTNCFLTGKPHLLHLNLTRNAFSLTLTNKSSLEKWKSVVTAEYVESMTRKTGNFKTFDIFSDMMKAAFLNASPSLSIKLVTQAELEKLSNPNLKLTFPETTAKRRVYFILIYTSEFDRIHYPLPMDFAGFPNPEMLQATIHGLENDKGNLERQLEQYRLEFEAIKLEQFAPLKQTLVCTAEKCAGLEEKFGAILEEFAKLKQELRIELESRKKEFESLSKMQDSKINELSTEVKHLIEYFTPDPKLPTNAMKFSSSNKKCASPRNSVLGQGDEKRWNVRRSSIPSPRFNSRKQSPKRVVLDRPESLRSFVSVGSARSGKSAASKINEKKWQPTDDCLSFSDSEVNAFREQIEALQKAVLGLADNFKPSK
ncbi:Coiled-coil domain containing 61 [Nesidiocoris tenuis]|uniref:Coiled-coil domain containing 61 n=1 Tax=Nesidiocoris tenuis TaxID=355587 RepID=A0ABN7AZX3_9HEMI|nr:Coiled-coil domain containing 61 [Nesidiocoris tenuis]